MYKSYQSRSNHIKKFHPPEPAKNCQKPPENNTFQCENCNFNFTRLDSLKKHINFNRCKELNNKKIIKENELLKKQNEELIKLLQKSLKIHPKSLNKINNQLVNNGTINNNTINIVQLGHENLSEVLSRNQKINILNRQAMSINDLVELVHVSSKFNQFKNVYITNLQSSYGYMYNEKLKKFITVNKNDLINDILDSRMYN